jgi:hypothetical protein
MSIFGGAYWHLDLLEVDPQIFERGSSHVVLEDEVYSARSPGKFVLRQHSLIIHFVRFKVYQV